MTHHIVTGNEVREIGRLIIAFSNALGVEPGTLRTDELCERVRGVVGEVEHLRAKLATVAEHRDELGREAGWNAATAADLQLRCNRLSGLLRGMARRVHEYRQAARAEARLLDDANRLHALAIESWRNRFAAATADKPNPWFTPAEFPVEAAERADRERASIAYAFRPQEFREDVASPFVPDIITALAKVRDRKADAYQQHVENVARIVEAVATNSESLIPVSEARARAMVTTTTPDPTWAEAMKRLTRRPETEILFGGKAYDRLITGQWDNPADPADDERTVRIPGATPLAPSCELHFRGGCASCGGTDQTEEGP